MLPMAQIIFRCPNTSMIVQHWMDDDEPSDQGTYEAIECPACERMHFINKSTGKLLGDHRLVHARAGSGGRGLN
jgi:hypothetical protein